MSRPKKQRAKAAASAPLPTHSPDGVDLTLIRWMLSLTPAERLEVLQRHVQAVLEIRAQTAQADFLAILRTLREHGVDFIVVGGVSAVLQGAPVTTFDLDVVHARDPENVERLSNALEVLSVSRPSSPGHQLLMTKFGPLDLLGMIGKDRAYADLFPHSVEMQMQPGFHVRVLDLATLIETKQETAGEKDHAVLPILRRTLGEKQRGRSG
jgi:hypothetical protein